MFVTELQNQSYTDKDTEGHETSLLYPDNYYNKEICYCDEKANPDQSTYFQNLYSPSYEETNIVEPEVVDYLKEFEKACIKLKQKTKYCDACSLTTKSPLSSSDVTSKTSSTNVNPIFHDFSPKNIEENSHEYLFNTLPVYIQNQRHQCMNSSGFMATYPLATSQGPYTSNSYYENNNHCNTVNMLENNDFNFNVYENNKNQYNDIFTDHLYNYIFRNTAPPSLISLKSRTDLPYKSPDSTPISNEKPNIKVAPNTKEEKHEQELQPRLQLRLNRGMEGPTFWGMWEDERSRMVYVSWLPKAARARCRSEKKKCELSLKHFISKILRFQGLQKVLLFPPNSAHCKLLFDSEECAKQFLFMFGGLETDEEPMLWKTIVCQYYSVLLFGSICSTRVRIIWADQTKNDALFNELKP